MRKTVGVSASTPMLLGFGFSAVAQTAADDAEGYARTADDDGPDLGWLGLIGLAGLLGLKRREPVRYLAGRPVTHHRPLISSSRLTLIVGSGRRLDRACRLCRVWATEPMVPTEGFEPSPDRLSTCCLCQVGPRRRIGAAPRIRTENLWCLRPAPLPEFGPARQLPIHDQFRQTTSLRSLCSVIETPETSKAPAAHRWGAFVIAV